MDLQLAHDIISICNEDSGGATSRTVRNSSVSPAPGWLTYLTHLKN